MGIFYETRNKEYVNTQPNDTIFSAFPTHTIPLSALSYNEHRALLNSSVWTAVNLISRDISKMDIKIKEKGVFKDGDRLEYLLNKNPNPYMNSYMFKYAVMMNALLTGHGYIKIERTAGQVTELYHIKTSYIQLKENDEGYFYEINTANNETIKVGFDEIIDIKPFTMDGINALKVLDALNDDLNTQRFTKGFFNKFFANGGQNSGILRANDTTLSAEARDKLRDEFQKSNSGSDNAGKVLVLDSSLEYEQLEIQSDLLDVITKNKAPDIAIAKALNIPLSKFALEQPNTSLKDSNADYLNSCLHGYIKTWESELNFKLINDKDKYKKEFAFDTSSFRKIDWESYKESLRADLEKGAITINEYRKEIGLEPYKDYGDVPRFDLNHVSATIADDYSLRKISTNNQSLDAIGTDLKGGENN
ncbi:phage portal protein [Staphylococcus pseudintermedius]|uniref:phage portal protein n=1 Tax=Staphylococcus pseudintermedius TaxID=283734 RepID=UPI0018F6CE26|nr:phage portal protein [Staphylococcus pseudintermedius]EGQ3151767.1 phage portal protein [Staphylococcus pseudintermedius]EGQ3871459.1 phage portal protein [Staphylococcus pseudintermedius]EHL7209602.1 phage portal protein [Staphylococcus pseudintermedius]EIM5218834.1 phage portal protein [Staphylococcus pseudintermedius]EIT0973751.1 phage portal protein [Staphylococcus pseudintermedius]